MQTSANSTTQAYIMLLLFYIVTILFATQPSHCLSMGPARSGPSSPAGQGSPTHSIGSLSPLTSLDSWPSTKSIESQPPSPPPNTCGRRVCLFTAPHPKKAGWFSKVRTATGPVHRVTEEQHADSATSLGGKMKAAASAVHGALGKIVNPAEKGADKIRYTYHYTQEGKDWANDPRRPRIRSEAARERKGQTLRNLRWKNKEKKKGIQQGE